MHSLLSAREAKARGKHHENSAYVGVQGVGDVLQRQVQHLDGTSRAALRLLLRDVTAALLAAACRDVFRGSYAPDLRLGSNRVQHHDTQLAYELVPRLN